MLARIIHAVEQAQGSRAPTQQFVDRFAAIYTPAVFALALAVGLLTPWLMGWTWMQAIYKALVLLVIACPCALVISTPVTVVSGLAAAARRGILIKGGIHLEGARKIKEVTDDGGVISAYYQLPGKEAGRIKITFTGGDNPESEFSIVEFIQGEIDHSKLENYYIEEIKI